MWLFGGFLKIISTCSINKISIKWNIQRYNSIVVFTIIWHFVFENTFFEKLRCCDLHYYDIIGQWNCLSCPQIFWCVCDFKTMWEQLDTVVSGPAFHVDFPPSLSSRARAMWQHWGSVWSFTSNYCRSQVDLNESPAVSSNKSYYSITVDNHFMFPHVDFVFFFLFLLFLRQVHLSVAKCSNLAACARRPYAFLPLNNERYDRIRRIQALWGTN